MQNNVSQLLLKIEKYNGLVQIIRTSNKSRFLHKLAKLKIQNTDVFNLSVTYKEITDIRGIKVKPTNKGFYKTKKDLKLALFTFLEN